MREIINRTNDVVSNYKVLTSENLEPLIIKYRLKLLSSRPDLLSDCLDAIVVTEVLRNLGLDATDRFCRSVCGIVQAKLKYNKTYIENEKVVLTDEYKRLMNAYESNKLSDEEIYLSPFNEEPNQSDDFQVLNQEELDALNSESGYDIDKIVTDLDDLFEQFPATITEDYIVGFIRETKKKLADLNISDLKDSDIDDIVTKLLATRICRNSVYYNRIYHSGFEAGENKMRERYKTLAEML